MGPDKWLNLGAWTAGVALIVLGGFNLLSGFFWTSLYGFTMGALLILTASFIQASNRERDMAMDLIHDLAENLTECTGSHRTIVRAVMKAIEDQDLGQLEALMAKLKEGQNGSEA